MSSLLLFSLLLLFVCKIAVFSSSRSRWFSLLFPPAAAAALKRHLPDVENTMAVKDRDAAKLHLKNPNVTSETHRKWWWLYCCCCSCPCYPFCSKGSFQMGKHHGSERRKSIKRQLPDGKTPWQWRTEKYQNCAQKLPNVTSETHRKGYIWF